MAKVEEGSEDFMLRVMDALEDAGHRQLQKIEVKKIKELAAKLNAVKDEKQAALDLRQSQKDQYEAIYTEVTSYLETISKAELLELPAEVKMEMENAERKIKKANLEAVQKAAAEEPVSEPD